MCFINELEKKKLKLSLISTTNMSSLPVEVVHVIGESLIDTEFEALLNTSKVLFDIIKKETKFYRLSAEGTNQFFENLDFQRKILSHMKDSSNQLSLKIETWTSSMQNTFKSIKNGIFEVKVLDFSDMNEEILDFNCFSGVSHLELRGNASVKILGNGFHTLKSLALRDFNVLTDISVLAGTSDIPVLTLVKIDSCHELTDFSGLKDISSVEIINCSKFIDGKPLEKVVNLRIEDCHFMTDFSVFSFVKQLDIIRCDRLTSFFGLNSIPYLTIQSCVNMSSIESLGENNEKIVLGLTCGPLGLSMSTMTDYLGDIDVLKKNYSYDEQGVSVVNEQFVKYCIFTRRSKDAITCF
jgi:hypothetical protein